MPDSDNAKFGKTGADGRIANCCTKYPLHPGH